MESNGLALSMVDRQQDFLNLFQKSARLLLQISENCAIRSVLRRRRVQDAQHI
jgi:hypothetical protein